jgi:hypothetical protein
MHYDIDVLIIFSEKDNHSTSGQIGWVTQLKKHLELVLTQLTRSKPAVLLKSEFDSITSPNLNNAAVLIAIVTPDFIVSSNCLDNLKRFQLVVQNQTSRIFKVVKSRVPLSSLPPILQESDEYDLTPVNSSNNRLFYQVEDSSVNEEELYWLRVTDLAYAIKDELSQLKPNGTEQNSRKLIQKTVYLAETGNDLTVQRHILQRELIKHGYRVLPEKKLPAHFAEFEKAVRHDLEEAQLAIHLIGYHPGEMLEGTQLSVLDLQNRIASEKSSRTGTGNFSRMIWISPEHIRADDKQRQFIENLKRETEVQEGIEILQTPIEEFKNIIREELSEPSGSFTLQDSQGKSVYLIHDRIDQSLVDPLIKSLENGGYTVLTPQFDGDMLTVRQRHFENLRAFDSAIIFKGKVNPQWVRMKILDLLKAPGLGRNKPVIGKVILTLAGNPLELEIIRKHNIKVVETDPAHATHNLQAILSEFS